MPAAASLWKVSAPGRVTLTIWSGMEAALARARSRCRSGERKEVPIEAGSRCGGLRPGALGRRPPRGRCARPRSRREAEPGAGRVDLPRHHARAGAHRRRGEVTLGPFLPGQATLSAFAPGEREVSSSAPRPNQATVVVTAGQQVGGLEMVISAGRQRISGTTLAPDGKPLAGTTVIADRELPGESTHASSIYARRSTSGGDGAFVIEGLSEGTFTVFGRHPEHPDWQVAGVRAGSADVRVRFARPGQIQGVVATRGANAVRECFVAIDPVLAPGERRPQEKDLPRIELEDPRGAFAAPRLSPGKYQVVVTTPDGLVAQAAEVELGPGETKRLRLVVEPGATLVGRVVDDASNAPAAAVEVSTRLPGQRRVSATTDQTGAFTLRGVPAGEKGARLRLPRSRSCPDHGLHRGRRPPPRRHRGGRHPPPPPPRSAAPRPGGAGHAPRSMTRTGPGASRPAHSPSACR